ncbi:condensation domain-containing protein [Nocardia sp. CC201C]|uniref:condensation domain-containing protein n=1 Tax=Nocardia sp. CC201C TaxID=3044575 RepID=UPI0024A86FBF|nr:condensation domain-containing protein [Nocardia sp. CC201C]
MTTLTDARLELLRRRLAAAGVAANRSPAPEATPAPELPDGALRTAERRMWKIYELDPNSVSHNIGLILDFEGGYTLDGVIASFETMVRNGGVLGSVVATEDGVPRRVPARVDGRWVEPGAVWEWGTVPERAGTRREGNGATETRRGDAAAGTDQANEESAPAQREVQTLAAPGHGASERRRDEIAAVAEVLTRTPFDLTVEPPLRARIYAGAGERVTLVLVVHHLAVDDTSWPLLLGTLTTGAWPAETDRPNRSNAPVTTDEVERALRHAQDTWAAEGIRFPLSGELPAISAAESWLSPMDESPGARFERPLERAAVAALEGVAREVGSTSNALLIAICAVTVYALTDAADHVLLVPADNRRQGESPDTVGYSGNIVPMRFAFAPDATVRAALRDAVSVVYRSMEFTGVDYGTVLTALRAAGGRFPVAEIMASVRNAPLRGIPIPDGRRVDCASVFHGVGNYPLTLAFELGADDGVHLEVDHQPEAVDAARAHRAAAMATALVARIPGALDRPLAELVGAVRESETG